jgi:glucose-6-phosphate isomerase
MLEVQIAFAGEVLGIDAFDQPGIEGGKVATYALMGRPGYDEERRKIAAETGVYAAMVV